MSDSDSDRVPVKPDNSAILVAGASFFHALVLLSPYYDTEQHHVQSRSSSVDSDSHTNPSQRTT